MSWRTVVIANRAKLDYSQGCLVCRGEKTQRVHLSEIATLVIETTAVSLTSGLLCELVRHGIKVIFCDEKYNPQSELIPYCGCHDSADKLRQQLAWTSEAKRTVWAAIIKNKIYQQAELLHRLKMNEGAELLDSYIDAGSDEDIISREGIASRVYFINLWGTDFVRNDSTVSINLALNYGYALILSSMNREIVANGYIPQLGIHHIGPDNPFNLGCDLMEPFRPLVDGIVFQMNPNKFSIEEKRKLQELFQITVKQGGEQRYLSQVMETYARTVFQALSEQNTDLLQFYER